MSTHFNYKNNIILLYFIYYSSSINNVLLFTSTNSSIITIVASSSFSSCSSALKSSLHTITLYIGEVLFTGPLANSIGLSIVISSASSESSFDNKSGTSFLNPILAYPAFLVPSEIGPILIKDPEYVNAKYGSC